RTLELLADAEVVASDVRGGRLRLQRFLRPSPMSSPSITARGVNSGRRNSPASSRERGGSRRTGLRSRSHRAPTCSVLSYLLNEPVDRTALSRSVPGETLIASLSS